MAESAVFAAGIDLSLPKLRRATAESNRENTSYVLADWDHLPFRNGCLGAALFLQGPEHALAPSTTLAEITRVITDSGYLVISAEVEPQGFYTNHIQAYLRGRTDPPSKPFNGHLRIITPSTLKQMIPAGYEIEEEVRHVPKLSFPLKRTLERRILGRRQYSFTILVARKATET
jgi:ubiquinone/menaquinone biosynthesis C-methylase UbiE